LEWVLAQFMLAMTTSLRALACRGVVAAQQMENIRGLEPSRIVGLSFGVNQQRELDAGFFAKGSSVDRIAQADSRELCASLIEIGCVFAQLRDMLTAEDSSVMAQENDDGGRGDPERSELDGPAVRIGQRDRSEAFAEGARHASVWGPAAERGSR
jgi:hypothetical protein